MLYRPIRHDFSMVRHDFSVGPNIMKLGRGLENSLHYRVKQKKFIKKHLFWLLQGFKLKKIYTFVPSVTKELPNSVPNGCNYQ